MRKIYTTSSRVDIYVKRGGKSQSPYDFIVKYKEPGKSLRTPKHIHLIVDLYLKRAGDAGLTNRLVDHIIDNVISVIQPVKDFPPSLQVYNPNHVLQFQSLDRYGEYAVEFLLVVTELILIQEKTNYPSGTMSYNLFSKFRQGADIFTVLSAATFRGR